MDTREGRAYRKSVKRQGWYFQNPDNQIISQVVEEDEGYRYGEYGHAHKGNRKRVEESPKAVGMYEFRKHSPNKAVRRAKQRVSIAGVIAMHPKCIILDEPTAMLDPNGRKEVIRAVRALNQSGECDDPADHTHYMEEVIYANG